MRMYIGYIESVSFNARSLGRSYAQWDPVAADLVSERGPAGLEARGTARVSMTRLFP
jgi:hypothetical protein